MRSRYLGTTVLGLVLVGLAPTITRAIDVSPPSPVPALSPTIITVTYDADKDTPKFYVVLGVVKGHMYVPSNVTLVRPGVLTFSGPPGEYLVTVAEKNGQGQQMVTVEGDDGPDPQPPPPPTPGKRSVVVVYESKDKTTKFELATQALHKYCRDKQHRYRAYDQDAKDPATNKPLKLVQDLVARAASAKVKQPFIAVFSGSSGVDGDPIALVRLPTEPGAAVKLLQSYGG